MLMAEVYDLDKPLDRYYDDVAYYVDLLRNERGRILELAVGTGRFLIPLCDAGLRVDGLDHSSEMLEICARHCRERGLSPVLHEANMAAFDVPERYDVVIVPSGALKELDGAEAALAALRCCHRALVPGGRLILDVVPLRHVNQPEPMRFWRREACLWTLFTMHLDFDAAANRMIKFQRYEKWKDGALVVAELHEFCMQNWSLGEVHALLADAGFADVSVIADYREGNPPSADNRDWTFHAVRH